MVFLVLSIKLASSEEYFSGNVDGEGKAGLLVEPGSFDFWISYESAVKPNSAGVIPKDAGTGSSTA